MKERLMAKKTRRPGSLCCSLFSHRPKKEKQASSWAFSLRLETFSSTCRPLGASVTLFGASTSGRRGTRAPTRSARAAFLSRRQRLSVFFYALLFFFSLHFSTTSPL